MHSYRLRQSRPPVKAREINSHMAVVCRWCPACVTCAVDSMRSVDRSRSVGNNSVEWICHAANHAWLLTLCGHIKTIEQRTIIQQYGDRYTGRWYSEESPGRAVAPPSLFITVPNVTAHPHSHPLTASVPTSYSMWHYNCLWILTG